jgi:hypothetical protein
MTKEKMFKKFDAFFQNQNYDFYYTGSVQFNVRRLITDLIYEYFSSNISKKEVYDALLEYANGHNKIVVNKKTYLIDNTVFVKNGKETYPYENHYITFIFTEVENVKAPGLFEKFCNLFKK